MSQQTSQADAKAVSNHQDSDSDTDGSTYYSADEEVGVEVADPDNSDRVDPHFKSLVLSKLDEIKDDLRSEINERVKQDIKKEVLEEIPREVLVMDKMVDSIKDLVLSEVTDALQEDITAKIQNRLIEKMDRELNTALTDELRQLRDGNPQREPADLTKVTFLFMALELRAKTLHRQIVQEAGTIMRKIVQTNSEAAAFEALAREERRQGDMSRVTEASLTSFQRQAIVSRDVNSEYYSLPSPLLYFPLLLFVLESLSTT
ncbi:hypothetical protein F4810DRAFT_259591 [Camillea tinctor]|nr:hypothetical protein F4810DRAFT_259591 [Camillea tinctor]